MKSVLCFRRRRNDADDEAKTVVPTQGDGDGDRRDVFLEEEPIVLTVNGTQVTVDTSLATPLTSLATFLREHLNLRGTKVCCSQAGCGACVVTAVLPGGAQGGQPGVRSVNSVRMRNSIVDHAL